MPAPINTFKTALKAGETLIGCWVGLADAYAAEIMTTAGFDWLLIDGEHAPHDLRSMVSQLQVIQPSNSHAVVRLPVGDTVKMKQILDGGAQTVLVPMIESADQARQIVRDTQYPPVGVRGVGASLARASRFGEISDYAKTADDQICLLLQVENRAGMAALDDILAIDEVDGVFIGPADLAADMGHIGNASHPDVKKAVEDCLTRIVASGKAAGILATDLNAAQRFIDLGATFVAVGIDVTLFAGAARDLAAKGAALKPTPV
jgi:4-hydroxy-2-oxoheptanedioate aldolase